MLKRTSTALRTLCVVGALALIAGCAGGEPDDDPTPIMPSTSTSTSTPEPTPEPEPWEVQSVAGEKAFIKRFVATFSEAERTGDTAALKAMTGPKCGPCDRIIGQIREIYDAGGRIEGAPIRVLSVSRSEPEVGIRWTVAVRSSSSTWYRSDSAEPEVFPGRAYDQLVGTEWVDDSWLIQMWVLG